MVDWNTKQITKDLLVNNWSLTTTPTFKIDDEENSKVHTPDDPEISIQELNTRDREQADIFYDSFNKSSFIIITIRSREDEVDKYWEETSRILLDNRTNLEGLPGGWDKLIIDEAEIPDPQFSNEVSTIQIEFRAFNDTGV